MFKNTKVLTFLFIALLTQASQLQFAYAAELLFESDVQVKKNSAGNFENVKSGATVKLNTGENIFVMTSQGLPMLIYSLQKDSSKIIVSDVNIASAVQEQLQPTLEKSVSEIVDGLRKAEALVQKRELNQAAGIISSMKDKYKNISSVLFLSGTVAYLQNNKTSAIEDLEKGLRLDPNNDPAKKLLAKLKGTP